MKLSDLVVNVKDFKGKIGGEYSYEQILLILHQNCPQLNDEELNKGGKVKSINFKDINNGQGNISYIYKTTVEFENSSQKEPFSVVLKIPSSHIINAAENIQIDVNEIMKKAHRTECDFYTLTKDLNDGFSPKVYYCEKPSENHPGLIVMEDLSGKCATFGLFRSGNIEQFWSVAKKIAHFQALVACRLKKEDWVDKFEDDYLTTKFYPTTFDVLIKDLVKYEPDMEEMVSKMLKVISSKFSKYALIERPFEMNILTLCHGDLWTNNMLFKKHEDGSFSNSVHRFIDWQLVFPGNPFFDLVRYLVVANDGHVRREIQIDVLDKYVKILKEEYRKLSSESIKILFTMEQAEELFDLAFVEQSALLMTLPPLFWNDKSKIHGEGKVLKAKCDKLVLRVRLLLEDILEVVERRGWGNRDWKA